MSKYQQVLRDEDPRIAAVFDLEGEQAHSGYEVIEAEDGMSALEKYHLEHPDLVMLDMLMKGMYGLDVLSKLREMDTNVRVVIVTADIQHSTREMANDGGALGFVNKPFAAEQLLSTVAGVLGKASQ